MAGITRQDAERLDHRAFVISDAEPGYRERQARLHDSWGRWNAEYFGGRLLLPHIVFDRTAHSALVHCDRVTGSGARLQITLNEGLVFGTNPDWVVNAWPPGRPADPPAEGTRRLIEDLLLRATVRQYVIEVEEPAREAEDGYGGYGPLFVEHANRIGAACGLGQVVARNRPGRDPRLLAKYWPCCVRPEGYYGDDVSPHLLDLACGTATAGRRHPAPPDLGLLEYLQTLLLDQRADRALAVITAQVIRLRTDQERKDRVRNRRMEAGLLDIDGSPLGSVPFDPAWNWDAVRHMARAAAETRDYSAFPVLADALQDAGCPEDSPILRHLRSRVEHTKNCWVLKGLLDLSR